MTKYSKSQLIEYIEIGEYLPGKNFKVLKYLGLRKRSPNSSRQVSTFLTQCMCGNETEKSVDSINETRTCGDPNCLYNHNRKAAEDSIIPETDSDGFFIKATTWTSYVSGSKKRNIEFSITPAQVLELWKKQKGICAISGLKMSTGDRYSSRGSQTWSINRKDSNLGYTIDNVELVQKFCNILLNRFDQKAVDLFVATRVIHLYNTRPEYFAALKDIVKSDIVKENNGIENAWKKSLKPKS